MSDIVLIQPKITGDLGAIEDKPDLPLALLSISNLLHQEYDIKIIDQRKDNNWGKELRRELNQNPICVGITSMTGREIKYALEVSKYIKNTTNIPVVWGGIHSTLLPKQTLENKNIDIAIQGEGEITFYELVKALDKGKSLKGIKGVWYKSNNKIKRNPLRPFVELNDLPEIPYYLVNVKDYMTTKVGVPTLNLETSRGCSFNCSFCYNAVYNRGLWRGLTAEKSFDRIKNVIENYKIRGFFITDDNFFFDLSRAKKIVKMLVSEGYDIPWQIQGARVDTFKKIDKSFFYLLDKSGCKKIEIGVESGSQKILNFIKKGITINQVLRLNKKFKDFDVSPRYNFITGFPTETMKDLKKTIKLIFQLKNENSNAKISALNLFVPYPGTEVYDIALNLGLKRFSTLEEWTIDYDLETINLPWISKERKKILESLRFTSFFLGGECSDYVNSKLINLLTDIYLPFAKYRTKNLFFKFMIEKKISNIVLKVLNCRHNFS